MSWKNIHNPEQKDMTIFLFCVCTFTFCECWLFEKVNFFLINLVEKIKRKTYTVRSVFLKLFWTVKHIKLQVLTYSFFVLRSAGYFDQLLEHKASFHNMWNCYLLPSATSKVKNNDVSLRMWKQKEGQSSFYSS